MFLCRQSCSDVINIIKQGCKKSFWQIGFDKSCFYANKKVEFEIRFYTTMTIYCQISRQFGFSIHDPSTVVLVKD